MPLIRNLIFDLGGVLFEIDYARTHTALQHLAGVTTVQYGLTTQADLFSAYEAGRITTPQFREQLRAYLGTNVGDQVLDAAFNALLLALFPQSLDYVQQLKAHYRIALLSNINELHFAAIADECLELFAQFERCFFSYQCGFRKPEPEIFNYVLQAMEFSPAETLLMDDSLLNIAAAQALGLQVYLVNPQCPVAQIIQELLARASHSRSRD